MTSIGSAERGYQRPKRRRRVQLAVPGSNIRMMEKAALSAADHVFLDLEDAVAPSEKVAAREKVAKALLDHDWQGKTRCVRINDLGTRWAYRDVIDVLEKAGSHLDTIMLPKARDAADIQFLDTLLTQLELDLELDRRIGIEVLIEEVEGLMHVERIATASPRVESLIFGMGDYTASHGLDPLAIEGRSAYPADVWHYGRWRIIMAARAAGIDAIDGPFSGFRESELYTLEAQRAQLLGMVGKWAIHPNQIPWALDVFTPAPQAVEAARRLVAAYEDAKRQGLGAIVIDGQMVDAGGVRLARVLIDRADALGL
ncbi:MAG: CoA ester lyase [Pigmentiphaga sp.]